MQEPLNLLVDYFSRSPCDEILDLDVSQDDDRLNPQVNKQQASKVLCYFSNASGNFRENGPGIGISLPGFWFDFSMKGKDVFIPVNVKSSTHFPRIPAKPSHSR
jgi:hypothetical protein